jgi:alkaline phosphatase D
MPIYRRLRFGNLMEMHVLDTRQYRNDQACGDGRKISCEEHQNPARTVLGRAQKNWLFDSLATTDAIWNVLPQQIMMARLRGVSEAGEQLWPMDLWDGYPYERQELLEHLDTVSTPNPIVLTGDIHANWAAELKLDFDVPTSKVVGSEYIGTSISSGGDGQDMTDYGRDLLANNSHVKFYNANRGYVAVTLTPDLWSAAYKIVPYITTQGAPISLRKTYVTEAGRPGIEEG